MITIIVPIHNTKKYLDKCLNSIKKQTYKNIEVLCIDSSNDDSTKIIKKYINNDSRFKLIRDLNSSYGYKINLGISKAKGDYIGIVDSDDYISKNMYENAYKDIRKYKVDFIKYDYYSFDEEGNKEYHCCSNDISLFKKSINSNDNPNAYYDSNISIWSGLYRKDFLIKNKVRLNESPGACFQDTGFFVFALLYAKKIQYINKPYYMYRVRKTNSSSSNKNAFAIIGEYNYIFNKIKEKGNVSKEQLKAIICRKISSYYWNYRRLNKSLSNRFADKIKNELKTIYSNGIYDKMPIRSKNFVDEMYYHNAICNKKVSIVIPVYNQEKYLSATLNSVIKQDHSNLEIICVNDGSADSSLNILKAYKKNDKRIKIINQKHKGASAARNNGVYHATGKYLLFLDGDDLLPVYSISRLVCLMHKTKVNAIEYNASCIFEDTVLEKTNMSNYVKRNKNYGINTGKNLFIKYMNDSIYFESLWSVFFDKKWYIKNNIILKEGIMYEDNQIWPVLHSKLKKVYQVNEELFIYNVHYNSTMTRKPTEYNIYSRLKCHMSNLKLINLEKDQKFRDALILYDKRVQTSIKNICINAGEKSVMKLKNYKLSTNEKKELNNLGIYLY